MPEPEAEFPSLSIVLGGAASGKSDFAERLVIACGSERSYVATAQAFDAEMAAKIARHKASRAKDNWSTIEAPINLPEALDGIAADHAVLIDCATLWLSNLLLGDADTDAATEALLGALERRTAPVVIVSNEVGQGLVPDSALGRKFTAIQGRFNQRMAARADLAVLVAAGLPLVLKGQCPKGMA